MEVETSGHSTPDEDRSGIVLDYEHAASRLAARLRMAEADILRRTADLARRLAAHARAL